MWPKVRIIVSCPESCVWLSSVCWTEGMHESIHSFDCSDNAIICGDTIKRMCCLNLPKTLYKCSTISNSVLI